MPSAFVLSSNRQSPQLLRVDPRFNRSRICPGRGSCRYLSRNKLNTARVIVRMAHTVFVYGTLLSEEIVKILLRRNPDSYAATVQGYSRYRIKGRVYPAILPTLPSDELTGMVLCGLSEQEFEILDGTVRPTCASVADRPGNSCLTFTLQNMRTKTTIAHRPLPTGRTTVQRSQRTSMFGRTA
ncbi:hypothetical protein ABBQ38_003985 [Trebouxia sp. C0009 RCD-2024]